MGIINENCRLCQIHVGTVPLTDNLCEIILDIASIRLHDQFYESLPQSICQKCNKKLLESNVFIKDIQKINNYLTTCMEKIHKATFSKNEETGNYSCNRCPSIFNNESVLKQHLLDHVNENGPFFCTICFKKCSKKSAYVKHKKLHPELICVVCNVVFDDRFQLESHICQPAPIEEKETPHLDINPSDKSGKIEFEFIKSDQAQGGLQTEGKKFICDVEHCLKVFKKLHSLKEHQLIHEGKRPYLCVACGKDFILKKSLISHEKIHASVKGYKCETCNTRFSVSSNLRTHIKTYHEGLRFHCSKCPKQFTSKCTLERHEKIHTGVKEFICNECTSAFYTRKELVKHQRYHQGIKPYSCDVCFRSFFERHHLIIHTRTHNGERPFVCKVPDCGKAFYEKQKLRRHENTVHSSKPKMSISENQEVE